MSIDTRELTHEQVQTIAKNLCEKNGFSLLDIKNYEHPDDFYLKIVLAHNEETNEYATWILNLDFSGLCLGHYFSSRFRPIEEAYQLALKNFNERW